MDIHFKSFFNPPLASFLKKRRILLKMILNAWIVSFVLLSGMQLGHAKQISKWEWEGIDRIVAIGDIHGSYDKFVILLKGTGLVDENLSWTGGNAHLVMVGDLVDRGKNDRGVVELVMRLQHEASSAETARPYPGALCGK